MTKLTEEEQHVMDGLVAERKSSLYRMASPKWQKIRERRDALFDKEIESHLTPDEVMELGVYSAAIQRELYHIAAPSAYLCEIQLQRIESRLEKLKQKSENETEQN